MIDEGNESKLHHHWNSSAIKMFRLCKIISIIGVLTMTVTNTYAAKGDFY